MSMCLAPVRLLLALATAGVARAQAHQIRSDWILQDNEYVSAFVNVTFHDPATGELYYQSGEIGRYSSGRVAAAAGRLLHVRSRNGSAHDGCELPWHVAPVDEPWIALVRHGVCSFDRKVENAYRSNASAVIIYDYKDGGLQRIYLKNQHLADSIVTVFIRKKQGEDFVKLVDKGIEISMQLKPGNHFTFSVENLNRTSVLFVSMSFILLLVISLAWLLFYYVQRFRYMHAKDRLARHLVSAARKALSRVPLRTLRPDDEQLSEAECCAVCLETYCAAECVRMLPCSHQFHMACVDPWLLKNRSCPMCKMDILKYYGLTVMTGDEGAPHVESQSQREASSPEPRQEAASQTSAAAPHRPVTLHGIGAMPSRSGPRPDTPRPGTGAEGSTCWPADGSTCRAVEGSTCRLVDGSRCAAEAAEGSTGGAALRRADSGPTAGEGDEVPRRASLPRGPSPPPRRRHSEPETAAGPRPAARVPSELRLSMPHDDDVSLDDSAAEFQSCHLASCTSLESGGSRSGAPAAAAVVVVHMSDADERDESLT